MDVAFYTLSTSGHLPGLVALLNSLRLVGHEEPIVVLDCGLAATERAIVERVASVVEAPPEPTPHFAKWTAPSLRPADVMVLVDADVIITRRLGDLIALGAEGKVVAFADGINRFDPRWGELLGLGPLRRIPYVNTGFFVLPRALGLDLLSRIRAGQQHVELDRTLLGLGRSADPFYYLDQDVANAVVATLPPERLVILESRLAPHPPFRGLRRLDGAGLRCRYDDGVEPFLLHHVDRKPWSSATRSNLYSRLLAQLLLDSEAPLRLPPERVPPRLRTGALASIDRWRADVIAVLRTATRGRLGVRGRLARRPAEHERRSKGEPPGSP